MTVESEERVDVGPARAEAKRGVLQVRWVSLPEAARMLNISEVAVRKQIAAKSLTGMRAGRGWRVLIPGSPDRQPESPVKKRDETAALEAFTKTSESLTALLRETQQQNLLLAAEVGYLQNQVTQAKEQVKLLEERQGAAVQAASVNHEHDAALKEIMELRKSVALYQQELAKRQQEPEKKKSWVARLFGRGGR